jgi:hypothetical protein
MPGQQVEHVVEKPDAGFDRRRAGAVEIDRDLDVGFLGLARHLTFAHFHSPDRRLGRNFAFARAFYQGRSELATGAIAFALPAGNS